MRLYAKIKYMVAVLFLFAGTVFSQQSGFEAGNKAYAEEDYEAAIVAYNKLITEGYHSTNLYYNVGNAYYRTADLGKAIWAYEKALKIDPSHKYAKENLAFTKMETVDKIDNSAPGIGSWLQSLLFGPSINIWAYISIFSSVLFSLSLLVYFRSKKRKGRNLGLLLGGFTGLLLLFTIITAHQHKLFLTEHKEGVIIATESKIRVSPMEKASESFVLHAGTKVEVTGTNEDWVHIEVNGNSGWVLKQELWEI